MGPFPIERHAADGDAVAPRPGGLVRWAAIPAAIGLLVLVVLGSHTAAIEPVGGGLESSFLLTALRTVGYVALILGIPGVPLAFLLYRRRQQQTPESGRHAFLALTALPLWARVAGVGFVAVVFAGQSLVAIAYLATIVRAPRAAPARTPGAAAEGDPTGFGFLEQDSAAIVVALAIVAAMAAVVIALAIKWRLEERRRARPIREEGAAVATRAVEVSLAALEAEADPRRAVITAYIAMERVLARAGLGRLGPEAPVEYLRRVLAASFRAPDDVATITRLFQIARFSHHPVDERMRSDAIGALRRIGERPVEPA